MLEPDATMIEHAKAANQRLLKSFPIGFALDETHHPHITCLQRYVETADLNKLYEVVGKVLAEERPTSWKLKAYKYYYIPWKNIGLAGIVIEPTDDLIRFQKKLIDAVAPFTEKTGTAAAFVTTAESPDINQPTIDYVTTYVPDHTGKNFNPHVTIGIASQDYLKKLLDEKFEAFTFLAGRGVCLPIGKPWGCSEEAQELGVQIVRPCKARPGKNLESSWLGDHGCGPQWSATNEPAGMARPFSSPGVCFGASL
jgi:hypothetical protein